MQRFSPRRKRTRSSVRVPNLEVLHWEEPLETLALEATGLTFGQRSVGNRNSTHKGCTQNFHTLGPRAEGVIWKEPGSLQWPTEEKTFILHINTHVYTHKPETKVLPNNLSCSHIFYSMLFSQKTNAVNCPLHWFLHPLMSPPEVWKTHVWFSKPSYIISSQWLRQEGEDCSTKLMKKIISAFDEKVRSWWHLLNINKFLILIIIIKIVFLKKSYLYIP